MRTRITGDRGVFEFDEKVKMTCPFCDGVYTLGEAWEAGATAPFPMLMHSVPHCAKFESMGLLEFLRAARLAGARPLS